MKDVRSNSHNVLITTGGNILPLIAALVTAPVLARSLDVDGRGELAAAVAPLILAVAGLTLGAPEAITYFVARRQSGFWRGMLLGSLFVLPAGLLGMLAIILCSDLLGGGNSSVALLIAVASSALLPSLAALCIRGYARGRQAWGLIALDQAVAALFKVAAISGMAILGYLTVTTATAITAIGVFIGVCAYAPLAWRRPPKNTPTEKKVVKPAQFVKYGGAVWIGTAAGILLTKLDLLLILPLSDSYVLGIYIVAVNLADVIRVFIMSVRDVVFSTQSALVDDDSLARACRLSNGLAFVVGLLLVGIAIPLVPLVFGSDFAASVPALAVLIAGVVIGSPGSVMAAGLTARGKPLLRSFAIVCGLAVDVGLVFVLVPRFGAMGAAVASACAYAISGIVVLLLGKWSFGLKITDHLIPTKSDLRYFRTAISRLPGGGLFTRKGKKRRD